MSRSGLAGLTDLAWLIWAMIAVTSVTPKRSAIASASILASSQIEAKLLLAGI
jgi:hypothetical protein